MAAARRCANGSRSGTHRKCWRSSAPSCWRSKLPTVLLGRAPALSSWPLGCRPSSGSLAAPATGGEARWLLVRRGRSDGELAFYTCYGLAATPLVGLVRVAGTRWAVRRASSRPRGRSAWTTTRSAGCWSRWCGPPRSSRAWCLSGPGGGGAIRPAPAVPTTSDANRTGDAGATDAPSGEVEVVCWPLASSLSRVSRCATLTWQACSASTCPPTRCRGPRSACCATPR